MQAACRGRRVAENSRRVPESSSTRTRAKPKFKRKRSRAEPVSIRPSWPRRFHVSSFPSQAIHSCGRTSVLFGELDHPDLTGQLLDHDWPQRSSFHHQDLSNLGRPGGETYDPSRLECRRQR